jgi:hypothetical protein
MKQSIIIFFLILYNLSVSGQNIFFDDFETNLSKWEYSDSGLVQITDTNDSIHRSVLKLIPNKTSDCILIKNSDKWSEVLIEGQVLFPTDKHNYLGLVYNYNQNERIDFGCIYIKGNDSYIRVNPHRDGNASRALYEEYKTNLIEEVKIKSNVWVSFKAEIIGSECHFYVQDMKKPKVIFKHFEYSSGKLGFKPRFAGGECWLDNIQVNQIAEFSYTKPENHDSFDYQKESMLNRWKAIGPFCERIAQIEEQRFDSLIIDEKEYRWYNFQTDDRGCLVVGKICRYSTNQRYAYFSTTVETDTATIGELTFSSLNNLQVWVNSKFIGSVEKQKYAWYDFVKNPEHKGKSLPIKLRKGTNTILILVEGANYSGDGFYAQIKKL